MTRRELALQSFWSERPLVQLFCSSKGLVSFTLKELIAFAESLDDATFDKVRGGDSQSPPHVRRANGDHQVKRDERSQHSKASNGRP